MTVDIDVEDIFPQRIAGRPRLQARHRNPRVRERQQQFMQCAGTVRGRHDQRCLVATGRAGIVLAEHQEPGRVVWLILDVFSQARQLVAHRSGFAGDCRRTRLFRGMPGCLGIAPDRNALRIGQHAIQPLVALRQRLGVRIDLFDRIQVGFVGEQVLVDAQDHFAADFQLGAKQEIHRPANGALGRILHRHHGIMGMAGFDLTEDVVNR